MRTAAAMLLLSLTACATTDFRASLPADARDYLYTKTINDNIESESLTNPAAVNLAPLPKGTTTAVAGYKRVHDRRAGTTRTFRTEVRREGRSARLVVTDVATGEVVLDKPFPPLQDGGHTAAAETTFNSVDECIRDFLCRNGSQLLCDANRTCTDQLWALTCCLKSGLCVSAHGVVRPNSIRCATLSDIVVDFEGLVLTQE